MEDVFDTVQSVAKSGFRFGQRMVHDAASLSKKGAKEGLKLTKSVLKQIPVERLSTTLTNRSAFLAKYGRSKPKTNDEDDDEDPLDTMLAVEVEEYLTNEEVAERVDAKYFDKTYDAVRFELSQLEAKYEEKEQELAAEKKLLEESIRSRRQMCDLVGTALKRRVLDNHQTFVSGIEQIQKVNAELAGTARDCNAKRQHIRKAKDSFAVGGLRIVAMSRQRHHLRGMEVVSNAAATLVNRHKTFTELIEGGRFVDAATLIQTQVEIPQRDLLLQVKATRELVVEWEQLTTSDSTLCSIITNSLAELLTNPRNFSEQKYRDGIEASLMLRDEDNAFKNVVHHLWTYAVQSIIKSLTEVSHEKDETVLLSHIAQQIAPDHVMLAVVQLCGRTLDFVHLYYSLCRYHVEMNKGTSTTSALHKNALDVLKSGGRRIGADIVEKLCMVLPSLQLATVDLDRVLHIYLLMLTLLETLQFLSLSKDEIGAGRSRMKASLNHHMARFYQRPKAEDMLSFMAEDTWTMMKGCTAGEQIVVEQLSPQSYKDTVKLIKNYVTEGGPPGALRAVENPYYTHFAAPQDLSASFQTTTLAAVAERDSTVVLRSDMLLTGASRFLANVIFEYVAKVAVRFPPLATEVLNWCEDLVCIYLLTIAENFVSFDRDVPLEDQQHLTDSCRGMIRRLRSVVTQTLSAKQTFPPRIDGNVKGIWDISFKFAIVERSLAVESAQFLVACLQSCAFSVAQLVPESVVVARRDMAAALSSCSVELLQVLMHRMAIAIFPSKQFEEDVPKMSESAGGETSEAIKRLVSQTERFVMDRPTFPTRFLDNVFLARLIFSIQCIQIEKYSQLVMNPEMENVAFRVGRRKTMSDMFKVQLTADAGWFTSRVVEMVPGGKAVMGRPQHVSVFLNIAFEDSMTNRFDWIREHHTSYNGIDIANWLCMSSVTKKKEIEALLVELQHRDVLPIFGIAR